GERAPTELIGWDGVFCPNRLGGCYIVISTYIEKLKKNHSKKNLDLTRLIFMGNDYTPQRHKGTI
ncbi:MAG: hypothetical protein RLZZ338_4262, partial [Cyanobacteriota bacterium]